MKDPALLSCPFLDTIAAAAYLGVSPQSLERWRTEGTGPAFRKHGRRVLYAIAELKAYSESHSVQSTTEARAKLASVG